MQAYLILANGRVFRGVSVGCPGTTIGEVVFATGMVGFEETLTDPSYYGQIITQTYPLIGNYGMNSEDVESTKIWARGYIVREACKTPSNFRSEETLDAFLKKNGIIGIEGIDTRSLTRTLRESGVMNGAITTEFDPDAEPEKKAALLPEIAAYAVVDAVKAVTCREAVTYEPTAAGAWGDTPLHVALLDLGCKNNIVRCLQTPSVPDEADTLIIESTYGDSPRPPQPKDTEQRLAEIIDRTITGGGNVVIPSFAVGRTQELLYMLRRIKEQRLSLTDFQVYLDSPLAIEATAIYKDTLRSYFDEETNELLDRGVNPIGFDGLHLSVTGDDSKNINADPTPKVIISASGMCEAGRIRHHLKHNLWRPECTVLFVGYQVEGTLGRRLLNGARYVNLFGEDVRVAADIENLEGISAHADMLRLVDWIASMKKRPTRVYVNHGSDGRFYSGEGTQGHQG